jgi:hypothetical protein
MSLTEEDKLIQERIAEREGKRRGLENLNSKINNQTFTPSIPDNTPSDLQSVFSTDMDGYNPFVTKRPIITNAFNATLPEKYSLETLANKTGPLYQGGKKSKKRGFSKSKKRGFSKSKKRGFSKSKSKIRIASRRVRRSPNSASSACRNPHT